MLTGTHTHTNTHEDQQNWRNNFVL